ncbi:MULTISPECIES: FkbM family methyltransferase [unclassified Mesorhizobium]|uniref:FkbM family methyltransferase n=1 Tax=unclassified Mesorhizobium TaxID=325217 RepID=UPI00115E4787|nr:MULTISPECIES: FkbM family methyltransferase [unclassified Mesorhizobium]TRD00177.1 FkbM family methyltransferase [Mesorhizobium sp. WSM4305]
MPTEQPGSPMRVFTTHGTVLNVDPTTGELRHGSPAISPPNARLVFDGPRAQIMHVVLTTLHPIACSTNHSWSIVGPLGAGTTATSTVLEVVRLDGGQIALKALGAFLSAESDGRITLSRTECGAWERFTLREPDVAKQLKIAAVTMVYNERVFLPIWRRHYGRAVGEENLFVLDHGSDDGSTNNLGRANTVRVPRDKFDEYQRSAFVSRFQASLLCYYDAVIFSDVDEILIPDPALFAGLVDFVGRQCDQFVTALGVEVQHLQNVEPNINLSRPILSQRRYVRFAADYCKPLISRIPLTWDPGFHSCQYPQLVNRSLFLFHLKAMDRNLALENLRKTQSIQWAESSLGTGHGTQFRLSEDEFIRKMFPYSLEEVNASLIGDFDFSDDLSRLRIDRANTSQSFKGGFAIVPDRFLNMIDASVPASVPARPEVRTADSWRSWTSRSGRDLDLGKHLVVADIGAAGGLQQSWSKVEDRIVAVMFEPNPARAVELRKSSNRFAEVVVIQSALGEASGISTLYLTKSSGCSSTRLPNRTFLDRYSVRPAFDIRSNIDVEVKPYLELFLAGEVPPPDVIKIDTQGTEFEIIKGFGDLLSGCLGLQLEAHLYPIYEKQRLFHDLVMLLDGFGLVLRRISPVDHFDGDVVELDAWFTVRQERIAQLDVASKWKLSVICSEWGLTEQVRQFPPSTEW